MRDHAYEQRFFELLRNAEVENYAPHTGPFLEDAFKLADEHADPEYGLLARYFYVFAVAPIQPRQAVVAFTWCLANMEHTSELIPERSIVHLYGIIGGILRSYPDYSLEQIEGTFDEMEEKFRELGLPMRDMWHHRVYGFLGVGDRERAAEYFERWSIADPTPGSCSVCDVGTRVIYHLYFEDYETAFRWAEPIWSGMRCEDGQPLMTASASILPLLREGRRALADQCYRMSVTELTTLSYAGIWAAGRQLAYLAIVGTLEDAIASFDRYFVKAWTSGTPADRFGYLISARLFARRLAEERERVELQIPAEFELHRDDRIYEAERLLSTFDTELRALGRRFDERNGNREYMRVAGLANEIYDEVRRR